MSTPETWSLNICVLDHSGNPVDMAAIAVMSSPVPLPDIAALTGPNGQVSISVPCAGEYRVLVNAAGFSVVAARIGAVSDDAIFQLFLNE